MLEKFDAKGMDVAQPIIIMVVRLSWKVVKCIFTGFFCFIPIKIRLKTIFASLPESFDNLPNYL